VHGNDSDLCHAELELLTCYPARPVRLVYQPPVNGTFISEQTSNQPTVLFSQNKPAPVTSQTNMLLRPFQWAAEGNFNYTFVFSKKNSMTNEPCCLELCSA
jgi:hypothetical protein